MRTSLHILYFTNNSGNIGYSGKGKEEYGVLYVLNVHWWVLPLPNL